MPDRDGRVAVAAAIATLAEYEDGPAALGHNDAVIMGIVKALDYSEDYDFLLRLLTGLRFMIRGTLRAQDDEVAESIIYYGGIAKLEALIDTIDPEQKEVIQVLVRVIQMLAKFKVRNK